jgi:hypothetical protein
MHRRYLLLIVLFVGIVTLVYAHTPLLLVEDNGDGTLYAEAGYSDGSGASGMECRLEDPDGNVLWQGKFDEFSSVEVEIPAVEKYFVVFDGGPGHSVKKEGPVLQSMLGNEEEEMKEPEESTNQPEPSSNAEPKETNAEDTSNSGGEVVQPTVQQTTQQPNVTMPTGQIYYPSQYSYGWLPSNSYSQEENSSSGNTNATLLTLIAVFLGIIALFLFLICILMIIQISVRNTEKKN